MTLDESNELVRQRDQPQCQSPVVRLFRDNNARKVDIFFLMTMTDIEISPNTAQTTSLSCLVEGESKIFQVTVSTNREIGDLKEQVHATGINAAQDLVLLKVSVSHRQQQHCRSLSVRSIYLSMRTLMVILDSSKSPETRKEFSS
jgi:hypothetical protein